MSKTEGTLTINRYDLAVDRSLRAHSAADELLLQNFRDLDLKPKRLAIYHDRFGFLACHLNAHQPYVVLTHKSQEYAILKNISENKLAAPELISPLAELAEPIEFALLKIPKSLTLFQLFLEQLVHNSTAELTVVAAFMTRHFSPKFIQIAELYFEEVTQSRAVKKARLLTLSKKKTTKKHTPIEVLTFGNQVFKQYWGVFSMKHIDYATQYFLEHVELSRKEENVLDLGSGNGVIGIELTKQLPTAEIHLLDDAYLAVESAKLNTQSEHIHHHFERDLSSFDDGVFDLIVTNPPFHFEYEINVNIPLYLFKECYRCLAANGNLQLVANKHLNYKSQLSLIFPQVTVLAENDKFIVYKCSK